MKGPPGYSVFHQYFKVLYGCLLFYNLLLNVFCKKNWSKIVYEGVKVFCYVLNWIELKL